MIIPIGTRMLLFRFNNYKNYAFIDEHTRIIKHSGYVWLMKAGRRTNTDKLRAVLDDGGYLVLKAPIKAGGDYYLCRFEDLKENEPDDFDHVPSYYHELIDVIDYSEKSCQFFKVTWIIPLPADQVDSLILQSKEKQVAEIIKETRTAVMFIKNTRPIEINQGGD